MREEEEYLKKVRSTKPKICDPPLYKLAGTGYYQSGRDQRGGFIGAILPLLRLAGPFIVDYAIQKFSGNGIKYLHSDQSELDDDEKKSLLLNILIQHPHLASRIFS